MKSTGFFVRIKRDDKWINEDIINLSKEELDQFLLGQDKIGLCLWVKGLINWIKELPE